MTNQSMQYLFFLIFLFFFFSFCAEKIHHNDHFDRNEKGKLQQNNKEKILEQNNFMEFQRHERYILHSYKGKPE